MEKKHPNEHFRVLETKIKNNTISQKEKFLDDIDLSQKTIVILCGNTTRSPMKASSYAKATYDWLDGNPVQNDLSIYSIFYPNEQPLFNNFLPNPEFDYKRLTKRVFKTAIKENEKFLPADKISQKLSNVVFFGHSVGGLIMNEMANNLSLYLSTHGYTEADIKNILSSIVFIGYSPFELVDKPIKGVYVTPLYDSVGSTKKAMEKLASGRNYIASNAIVKLRNRTAHNCKTYSSFLNYFEEALDEDDVVYFANNNTLISVPSLLYYDKYDGIREDHNLAGVLAYNGFNPNKTKAGEITTDFLKTAFNYSFLMERDKFSTKELFDLATITSGLKKPKKNTETNEESELV